ncbi:glucosidase I [Venturia nashicola]|nr:glucosidase I [Venturia nashicola]
MLLTSAVIGLFLTGSVLAKETVDDALLWGPYRPNLYFGVRPRSPYGPTFGLMWGSTKEDGRLDRGKLRHSCEQSDKLDLYSWTSYDVRTGGVEVISDPGNAVNLTLEFVKIPKRSAENWSLRVKGVPLEDGRDWNSTVIFYVGTSEEDYYGKATDIKCSSSSDGSVHCQDQEDYFTSMPPPATTNGENSSTVLKSLKVDRDSLWEAESFVLKEAFGSHVVTDGETGYGTLHFIERTFDSSFSFDIHMTINRFGTVAPEILSHYIQESKSKFDRRFDRVFSPNQRSLGQDYNHFSRSLLANLMGGIGYFYGDDRVNSSSAPIDSKANPGDDTKHELFTVVPSRAFLPRGFLRDEGFHLLVVMEWDLDLALDILKSWFALADNDGWIGHEQILGPEARSKVPAQFQIQNLDYANPPTLYLAVDTYLKMVTRKKKYKGVSSAHLKADAARIVIGRLYPLLKRHYEWWRRTQKAGDSYIKRRNHIYHSYRWRGQSGAHVPTSGMDDYPRTNPPGPHDLHVDALSWVTLMSDVLVNVADYLGATKDVKVFKEHQKTFERSLEFFHWSEVEQAYCDVTTLRRGRAFECHKGYISLLPFLLGSMNATHPHLNATLTLMRDEEELWSPHGLRSLSRSDELFGKDEDHWRGPIWININYLAIIKLLVSPINPYLYLSSPNLPSPLLPVRMKSWNNIKQQELSQTPGPHNTTARQTYISLRKNIINTVFNSWQQTGFAWEQYNPQTGAGQRTQGFTGWTALVVNILALPDYSETWDASDGGVDGLGGLEGVAEAGADSIALSAPIYLETGGSDWGFWFVVVVVVIFVLSGLVTFRAWYLKRTGLSGRRVGKRYAEL